MVLLSSRSGRNVYREDGIIRKWAHPGSDGKPLPRILNGLHQEARMLKELSGTGIAPELIKEGDDYILEEDLGDSQPVESGDALRRNGVRLLWTLQQHRISHGDPWLGNLIIREDRPMLLDFKMSRFFDEPMFDFRETSDQYHFWLNLAKVSASSVIRRWLAVVEALGGKAPGNPLEGKTLLDIRCGQGDFCVMAAAAGMTAHGIDSDGDSIAEARTLWADMAEKVTFSKSSTIDCDLSRYDIVLIDGEMKNIREKQEVI